MRSVTIDQVMEWRPCEYYSRERLIELAAGRERLTATDIAALPIPVEDRLWAVLHKELIPAPQLRLLACKYAEDALLAERNSGREPDPRLWAAIEFGRRHAQGKATDKELAAAWAAAWDAAWAAAWAAARAAAWAAARAAARDAARAAAWAAARAAARAAQLKLAVEAASEE